MSGRSQVISRGRSRSRSAKRKRPSRSRSRSRRRTGLGRPSLPLNGFPASLVSKHRYVETVTVPYTPASGATVMNYQINGLYNPNLSSNLDHQAKGFDEMMAIYKSYHVIGAKVHVKSIQTEVTAKRSYMWGLYVCPTATASTGGLHLKGIENILETKGVLIRYVAPNGAEAAFHNRTTATIKYSPKKVFGKNFVMTDRNQGLDGSNPSEVICVQLWTSGLLTDVTPSSQKDAHFVVTIDYIVKFSERKMLDQS